MKQALKKKMQGVHVLVTTYAQCNQKGRLFAHTVLHPLQMHSGDNKRHIPLTVILTRNIYSFL